jgi:cytochrome c
MRRTSGLTALLFVFVLSDRVVAQELDLTITDPAEIAAQCGGDAVAGREMFGRKIASLEGFDYSEFLLQAGAEGEIWERETLHAYLSDPSGMFPGYDIAHPVIAAEQDRNDLLTFLRTHTLPPPPAIGEVEVPEAVLAMEGDLAYGEFLSFECAGCHQGAWDEEGSGINGWPREAMITILFEYRVRARPNAQMQLAVARLSDEEIVSLADYFAQAR